MKLTEEEARSRLIAQREAEQEFKRLQERYWKLRETMTAEAILLAWFLLGDAMWEGRAPETSPLLFPAR